MNTNKYSNYLKFLDECKSTAQQYLDYLWNNDINYQINDKNNYFSISKNELNIPSMLSNVTIEANIKNFSSKLSARTKKCILTQVLGIIKANTEKPRKRIYTFNKLLQNNLYNHKLFTIIQKPLTKPSLDNFNPEINSICCEFKPIKSNEFDGFIHLKSLGEEFGVIRIPIKFHRQNKKYKTWDLLKSFLFTENFVNFRWSKEIEKKKDGIDVGADQGKKTIMSFSDQQITPKTDIHGHSLDSILEHMAKRKKGTKAFKKAQQHRKNFINWSINQLQLQNIKHVKLEEIYNINYRKNTSRILKHWTNTVIRDKLISICEVSGVHVTLQSCTYRSQRCSNCGLVRNSNRKGTLYVCSGCGFSNDADYNASCNHQQNLPDIPLKLRNLKLNRKGFYWKETGFYTLDGVEFTVPLSPTTNQNGIIFH